MIAAKLTHVEHPLVQHKLGLLRDVSTDTHLFRHDKPLYSTKTNRLFENFTRVETFGDPDTHWVRITVDPADQQVFTFKGEIVPENIVNRRTK